MALTEFGRSVIFALKGFLDAYDPNYSNVDAKELAEYLDKPVQAIDGALGHLIEGKYVYTVYWGRNEGINPPATFIYLTETGWAVE